MNKFNILIITILFLCICMFGCNDSVSLTTSNNEQSNNIVSFEKGEFKLDCQYENEIERCKSNIEICNANLCYAEKWYNLGNDYYNMIVESPLYQENREIISYVITIHDNWLEYVNNRFDIELKRLQSIYTTGTIVPMKMSQYKYITYRNYALEMYTICKQMNIQCESP